MSFLMSTMISLRWISRNEVAQLWLLLSIIKLPSSKIELIYTSLVYESALFN